MTKQALLILFFIGVHIHMASAQHHEIKGTLSDVRSKETLPGVTVRVMGGKESTQTDAMGNFAIKTNAPLPITLQFNFIGYQETSTEVRSFSTPVLVSLEPSEEALDEVVVVGYGTVRKRDLTGAVTSVKAKDITAIPTTNALKSLQGKVAGLDVTQSSGQPGANVGIVLRGNRSLNADNQPLVLVDGIQYGSFVDINPSDIASIEVLKDISSTAIYGTRGANGVIIITTKKGNASGRTNVSFNSYLSVNNKPFYPKMMDGPTYAQLKREAYRTTNNDEYMADEDIFNATELEYIRSGQFVDWQDLLFHTGLLQNYEMNLNGGNEKTQFAISLGYQYDKGMFKNDHFKRYNGRLSVDHTLNKIFKIGLSMQYTFKNQDKRDNPMNMANKNLPIAKPYNDDGSVNLYPAPGYSTFISPLADEQPGVFKNNINDKRLFGSGYIDIHLHKDLLFKSTIGIDVQDIRNGYFRAANTLANVGRNSSSGDSTTTMVKYTWENTLNYHKTIGDHDFNALAGTSTIKSKYELFEGYGNNQASDLTGFYDIGSNTSAKDIGSRLEEIGLASFFGRLNYKLKDRYLFQASLRADGSSVLSKGNKWGYFPSLAGAWRIIDEPFMSKEGLLNELKLRLSWGKAGNSAISPYSTLGALSKSAYAFGSSAAFGYWPSDLVNPNLTWETTATWNLGIDFGLFSNRISGAIELYDSKTDNLLLPSLLPTSTGYATVMQNVGKTANKGIEIAINTVNIQQENWNWQTDWSFMLNREKIVALNDGVTRNIANAWIVGEPTKIYYDYKKIGIWQLGEEEAAQAFGGYRPGDIKIQDSNPNGVSDPDDRTVFSQVPRYSFGVNNSVSYKNVDLTVFVFGRIGQYINYEYGATYKPSALENGANANYWTPENPSNEFPRPNSGYSTSSYLFQSTLRYVDGSFVKIRDITLGYTLPKKWLERLSVQRIRLYSTLQNYFVFTKVKDYDPERGGDLSFPLPRTIVFGVNVDL
ncbi:TonB-dependent receptor [Olivibacter sp. CPCC 100613]|uniref:SusC/RagA family TonB-linked outer membrane protein n=1 Tax=Olivibacter sp. CPCC 100613 TaxID=3079931 RepID=UPI002FF4B526